jgi:hypothetical protein
MKLKDARDYYYFNSGKTSDLIRQVGLAGIAIIWIFKSQALQIPQPLIRPLWLIALGLVFDLLQYSVGTLVWGVYQRRKELNKTKEDEEFKAPRWFNWPGISFFVLKVCSIGIAYYYIISFLIHTIC